METSVPILHKCPKRWSVSIFVDLELFLRETGWGAGRYGRTGGVFRTWKSSRHMVFRSLILEVLSGYGDMRFDSRFCGLFRGPGESGALQAGLELKPAAGLAWKKVCHVG